MSAQLSYIKGTEEKILFSPREPIFLGMRGLCFLSETPRKLLFLYSFYFEFILFLFLFLLFLCYCFFYSILTNGYEAFAWYNPG